MLALLLSVLIACGPSFHETQKADTIEAYEAWIAEASPSDPSMIMAEIRLEELYLEKAQAEKSLESYDAYLAKYPDGKLTSKAIAEREQFLYDWAIENNTAEGWQKYLDEYPKGKKKQKQEARRRIAVLEYAGNLVFGETTYTPVNLAEDPEGPMNGTAIAADITNNGPSTLIKLNIEIGYLNAEGRVFERERWPLVAPHLPGYLPVEEEFKVPMAPGETRQFYYTTADPESGAWDKKVTLTPVSIEVEGAEGEGDSE